MKKIVCTLILPLAVVSGLVFANGEIKDKAFKKSASAPLSDIERKAALKIWETGPDGIKYKMWEASPQGKKVYTAAARIMTHINDYTNIEAIVTSLSLPPGSLLGFGVMARINGDDYILRFDNDIQQLNNLKVNDKIIIRSHNVSYAPKYAYPIVSGEYAERSGKIIYKHSPRKGGC